MRLTASGRNFGVLCAASLLLWGHVLRTTFTLAQHNDAYTHILLIIPISVALVILERRKQTWKPKPGIRAGSSLLVLAAVIGVAGLRWGRVDIFTGDVRLAIEMLAVVTWWIGSFIFSFGGQVFRQSLFPLLFLLWLIPMPEFALNRVVDFLQHGTASCARELFTIVGVPVTQDGTAVTVPRLTVNVAEECSSIRSSLFLIVTSMVMSYLLLRSFWGRTVVILVSLPLTLLKNGLRVFTLAALGAYVSPAILNSPLHHQGGPLFLAIALAVLFGLIAIVRRLERRGATPAETKLPRLSASVIK